MQHIADGKQLVTTLGGNKLLSIVLCNPADGNINATLSPCTQEEAGTRMLLHTADAVRQGCKKIVLRTVASLWFFQLLLCPGYIRAPVDSFWFQNTYLPTKYQLLLVVKEPQLCLCSTLTRDAILFHPVQQEGRSWHGRPGMHLMM